MRGPLRLPKKSARRKGTVAIQSDMPEAEMSSLHRKRSALKATAAVAVLLTIAALAAANWIRSPEQRRAETAPPAMTLLTASVERRVLKDTVILRGEVAAGGTIEITPTSSGTGRAVVTGVRKRAGQEFSAGSVLFEVAGRPVIALPGNIPAYRDIRPGSEGKDVAQLQRALKSLGYPSSDRKGTYGQGTKRAVEKFYDSIGYDAATTGDDDEQAVAAAAEAVRQAKRSVQRATDERNRLAKIVKKNPAMADALREAERTLRYAREDLAQLKIQLALLESRSGPMMPMSEVVFLSSFPGRVEKLNGGVGQEVKAPLAVLSAGKLVVRASLNPGQRSMLKEGMPATVGSELTGDSFAGSIASIGSLQQDDSGVRSHTLIVKTAETLPAEMAGADLRLTVEAGSTDGEVLVVPISALYASADGKTAVQRHRPGQKPERVPVTVGVRGGGYAAVIPADGASLTDGEQVMIGEAEK